MAIYSSVLKPNAILTLEEVKEWLDLDDDQVDIPQVEVKSSLVLQDLTYTSLLVGVLGDAISVEYVDGVAAVAVPSANQIVVTFPNGALDADGVKALVDGFPAAAALVSVAVSGTGTTNQASPVAATNLAGGINDVPFNKGVERRRRRLEQHINTATDYTERYIQTNVLKKQFQEDIDGNNSNSIVPSFWPILKVDEVRIDFNRQFGAETIVSAINILLRETADIRQDTSAPELRIIGSDIVLRDDDEDNVIGRIFAGSSLGSVRVKYQAGWANDLEDIPSSIRQAALQLVEFYEFKFSERTIGISSKGVRGESYSKFKDGVPEGITELLDRFENVSLGIHTQTQNNTFGV